MFGIVVPWVMVAILVTEIYPSRVSTFELNGAVSRLTAQLAQLETQQDMPASGSAPPSQRDPLPLRH